MCNTRLAILLMVGAVIQSPVVQSHYVQHYRAAVYEHRRIAPEDGGVHANLAQYERAARLASQQGADLILYPEYGLFPASSNRSEIRKYLEIVPDPKKITTNPCDEVEQFADRPILRNLSCMAKLNGIVVVANMGSLEPCPEDPECPADGALQLNTNVAFGKNGALIARYTKEHLYFELSMDLPREAQDPVFETEFGKFAMFICFDIVYEKMAVTSRLREVDAVLFSTMWFNMLPLYTSTQLYQGWAMGNDATILASNIQAPGRSLYGSGIFRGRRGSVVHSLNPDGMSKLLVATLPRRNGDIPPRPQLTAILDNGTGEVRKDGTDVQRVCSYGRLGTTEDIYREQRCFNLDLANYTLVKLRVAEGRKVVCDNGMCCEMTYVANSMNESFYLGVFNSSTATFAGRYFWAEENCLLVRCDDDGDRLCSHYPSRSDTLFHEVSLTSNFTTDYVYPSFLGSAMKLVPVHDWTFSSGNNRSTITMRSGTGVSLISATLMGRAYQRDPPFIR